MWSIFLLMVCLMNQNTASHAVECGRIFSSNGSCPEGAELAEQHEIEKCLDIICKNVIEPDAMAHGKDMLKKISGTNLGCEISDWDGTVDLDTVLCSLPAICEDVNIVNNSFCPHGTVLADETTMKNCASSICSEIAANTTARGLTSFVTATHAGCQMTPWGGDATDTLLCLPQKTVGSSGASTNVVLICLLTTGGVLLLVAAFVAWYRWRLTTRLCNERLHAEMIITKLNSD
eukprot:TRINITY_DN21095_c0_g1_i1.p1 TRINITY_DN21095_c0_g1~~TRINITY_DN21095_c0_g1_i1.p1  ORF type:complete len:233 (+),score=28.02 TRINITY_DN21095_c0_g1_i1:49-747(+)